MITVEERNAIFLVIAGSLVHDVSFARGAEPIFVGARFNVTKKGSEGGQYLDVDLANFQWVPSKAGCNIGHRHILMVIHG